MEQADGLRLRGEQGGAATETGHPDQHHLPGPTETPLAQANKQTWLGFGAGYRAELGIEAATSLQQAYPLLFLCSDAASAINGITLVTDAGYFRSGITGSFPNATPTVQFLFSL